MNSARIIGNEFRRQQARVDSDSGDVLSLKTFKDHFVISG